LNTGSYDKEKAAQRAVPTAPAGAMPPPAQASRREIRTVLVSAHGWPTEAAASPKRRNKR
jgi:hypothetical protein